MLHRLPYFLLFIILFGCSPSGESASDVAESWLSKLEERRFDELKTITTGNASTALELLEQAFLASGDEDGQIINMERMDCKTLPEGKIKCTYCCGDENAESLVLVQEEGIWKVSEILVSFYDLEEETRNLQNQIDAGLDASLSSGK